MLTNRRFRILALPCILIPLTFFISGCWDRKEIENRGYVLGIAIDYVTTSEPKGQYDLPHVTQEAGSRKYRVTYELPKFRKKEERPGETAETHLIFTGEGESLTAIGRAINAKTYSGLFYEDIQVLVFSEAVARDGLEDLLDFFTRNPSVRRRVKLLVTPGRAEDVLQSKIPVQEVNGMFIAKITKNVHNMPRFASKTDLGDISEAIRNKHSFFMPVVVIEKGDVKLTKAALFNKDAKMVGELDEWEIVGAKILRTVLNQGIFTVPYPADPKKLIAFEILEANTKVNSHVEDDKLRFTLETKFIGNLDELTEPEQDALDKQFQAAVEQELAAEFTRQVQAAYRKQQEVKAEISDLGWLLYRQYPDYWEKVKDRWDDEVFPTVPLDVTIKVIIRRPGLTS